MRIRRNPLLAVLLVVMLFSFSASALTNDEAMLEYARQHISRGNYYLAATWLGRILIDYPATPRRQEVQLLLAQACGKDEKAVDYLRQLQQSFPEVAVTLSPELRKLANPMELAFPIADPPPAPPGSKARKNSSRLALAIGPPGAPLVLMPQTASPDSPRSSNLPPGEPVASTPPPRPEPSSLPASATSTSESGPTPQHPFLSADTPAPSEATPSPLGPEDAERYYSLVTDETVNRRKLDGLLKKLRGAGLSAAVHEEMRPREVYRLLSACYVQKKAAERHLAEIYPLSRNSFMFTSGESYCVAAGSLMSAGDARREARRLAKKGLQVNVLTARTPLTVWWLSIGRFSDERQAATWANTLAARGIRTTVVPVRK